jgi:hypothetical protein
MRPVSTHVRRKTSVLIALLALAMPLVGAAAEGPPTLFAAWRAPFGEPGAQDTLTGRCDNQGADTLYLSFDPGRDTTFYGITAMISFHTAPGDTFSQRWWFGGGEGNLYNVRVQVGSSEFPGRTAWTSMTAGGVRFFRTSTHGYLRMVYAQASSMPTWVEAGKIYCYARLVIPHPPPAVPLCDQPICVEFAEARLSVHLYSTEELLGNTGPHKCVALNSPDRRVCAPHRGASRPPAWLPWQPKKK